MSPGKPQLVGNSQPEERPLSGAQTDSSGREAESASQLRPGLWVEEQKRSYVSLLVLTTAALYLAYIVYRPFLKALFLALVLTVAFLPVHEWVARHIRGKTVPALITSMLILLVIMIPLMLITFRIASEAVSLYGFVSQEAGTARSHRSEWLTQAVQRASEQTGMTPAQIKSTITARVQEFGAWLVGTAGWVARGFAQQVTTGILTLLILFFFLRDREVYGRGIARLIPLSPNRLQELSATLHDTVVSNLYGMVAVGIIQGGLTALGWWITGLRAPFLWGTVAAIFSFIPLVGPSLVWIPGALVLATQGKWIQAAVLCAWGAIIVSGADYIVRPRFAGGRANTNTLLVLLSLLGGLKAFGAVGIIAGPVVLCAVTVLLNMIAEERERAPVRTAPVLKTPG